MDAVSLPVEVAVGRCSAGRLRDAYPVGTHDLELRVTGAPDASVLATAVDAVLRANAKCRRVVFAVPVGDHDALAAAEAAGFRYVLDVDVPGAELSLLVAEPSWVTQVDMDLDRVPGT